MAEAKKDAGGAPPAAKKDLGKFLVPILALVNILGVGGGAFLAYKATLGADVPVIREPAAAEELKKLKETSGVGEGVMFTMPPFTVNLAGTPRRLMRVEMTFEMLDKEGFEEIVRNGAVARDQIVRILNRKSFDDVETIQGKLFLKDQIAVTLNQTMKAGVVKDIYFNNLLIQ
jgi:flagellar FliL protein